MPSSPSLFRIGASLLAFAASGGTLSSLSLSSPTLASGDAPPNPLTAESLGLLPHMYSLLQISNRIADNQDLASGMGTGILSTGESAMNADGTASAALIAQASQFFELIEDPLLNLLVPVMVQIIMGIIRTPVINVVCEILGSVLAQLLAEPLAEATFPGADTAPMTAVVDAMQPKSPAAVRVSKSSSTTTTTTVTTEGFFLELGQGQGQGGDTSGSSKDNKKKKIERVVESLSQFIEAVDSPSLDSSSPSSLSLRWKPPHYQESGQGLGLRPEVLERAEELLMQRGWSLGRIQQVVEKLAKERSDDGGGVGDAGDEEENEEGLEGAEGTADEADRDEDLPTVAFGGDAAPHPGLHLDELWHRYYSFKKKEEENGQEAHEDAADAANYYSSFLELHTSAGPCAAAKTIESCHAMAPPVMKERGCTWCYKADDKLGDGGLSTGKCAPCSESKVKDFVTKGGMTCTRTADVCASKFETPEALRPIGYDYHRTAKDKKAKEDAIKRERWERTRPRAYEKGEEIAKAEAKAAAAKAEEKKNKSKKKVEVEEEPMASPSPSKSPSTTPSPSPSSSPLPDGVVAHNRQRKDWLPSDEASFPAMPSPVKGKPPENEATQQVVRTITDDVVILVTKTLHAGLVPLLRSKLTDKLSRFTLREATARVTKQVVADLHTTLPMDLLEQITLLTTKDLAAEVTQTLTEALVPTITESISRNPGVDLLCFLCRSEAKVYCEACKQAVNQDRVNHDAAWRIAKEQALKAREGLLKKSGIVEAAVAKSIEEETKGVIAAVDGPTTEKKKK